jgi:hypothetical protein
MSVRNIVSSYFVSAYACELKREVKELGKSHWMNPW